jgi:hypothetical protein
MSESLKFVVEAGGIFTALAGLLWTVASKTEDLMLEDVKAGFASWLRSTSLDKPFRDWCYSFTYIYDRIFGINALPDGFSFPRFSRTLVLATMCLTTVFFVFGQASPAIDVVTKLFREDDLAKRFPQFARVVIADLGLMIFVTLLLNFFATYLSTAYLWIRRCFLIPLSFCNSVSDCKRVSIHYNGI